MTLYLVIGLSWFLVGLAVLVLRLVKERDPETQWRVLLFAAATPFGLFPLASVCRLAIERASALVPGLDSPWPLALVAGAGGILALLRATLIARRQRALLLSCRRPDPEVAGRLSRAVTALGRAAGLRRPPRILVYPRGGSVCALGFRRPTIVLSGELLRVLTDDELRAVLAHEIAHVRRGDYRLNWLGVVLRSALFYLPPWSVGWGALAETRERDADRLATRLTGDPLALAAALIKVWRHTPAGIMPAGAVGMLARGGSLEARIRRLLEPEPPRRPFWRVSLTGLVLVGGLALAQTTVEGGTHLLARVSPAAADWEACCDPALSPLPHCAPPRRVFVSDSTIGCSRHTCRPDRTTGPTTGPTTIA
jgi:Zn-dependent protease with chaperone function